MKAAMGLRDPSLSLSSLGVIRALAWDANEDGECVRSVAEVAAMAGVSERSCQNAVADLCRRNMLQVLAGGGGRGHRPTYRVTLASAERVQNLHPLPERNDAKSAPFDAERVQNLHVMGAAVAPISAIKGAKSARASVNKELIPRETRETVAIAPVSESARASAYSATFERFWSDYGRKGSKQVAWRMWQQHVKPRDQKAVVEAVPVYLATRRVQEGYKRDAERFIKDHLWENPTLGEENDAIGRNGRALPTATEKKRANLMTGLDDLDRIVGVNGNGVHDVQAADYPSRRRLQSGPGRSADGDVLGTPEKPRR